MKDLTNIKFWLFDLDNTLYDGATKVFDQVDKKMSKFISEKLNVNLEEARKIQKNYFQEYNTTLNGMIKNHKIDADEFIEWEEVYTGNYYGTLKSEVERLWSLGKTVLFDVEVKGAMNLKKYFGDNALAIFVKVPSIEELKKRLTARGTESRESLSQRLYRAEFEMTFENKFDVTLLNENLEDSYRKAQKLVDDFLKP